jgi:hypothetical protein
LGLREKKVLVFQTCFGWHICIKWYQSGFLVCIFQARGANKRRSTLIRVKWYQSRKISLFFVAKKKGEFTMPPWRRDRHSLEPEGERESSRERGRLRQNLEVERQLQELRSLIVDIGIKQRRKDDAGGTSESKDEGEDG